MKIKGILFDKDGTLIDFYSLWLNIALEVIPEFIKINLINDENKKIQTDILETIGVKGCKVDPKGGLAYKSYYYIAEDIYNALLKNDININKNKIYEQILELFNTSATSEGREFKTFTDIKKLMQQLKDLNMFIGLATADTIVSAKICLEKLGILEYFDFVGGDDGILSPKPETDMFNEFAKITNLKKDEIVIVGDTLCDMHFSKKCGCRSIGVLSGVSSKNDLKENANYIIPSVAYLIPLIEEISS